ncbi:hypothetical protein EVAR_28794_1 [Eumeta japonica]|uniref:Nucleic-acid-binding protein from transposon X-element n=1 Tax=Eumeta variegata TaxID=151549 RepID=A0A4C1VGF5_EUMVA|nr:hypothetical protein EVAR_28794_1 [Eumeta japonica]
MTSRHKGTRSRPRDGTALGLVLGILERSDQVRNIFKKILNVCGLSGIVAEALYKREIPGKYHKCQLHGHTAANCYAQSQCVKCLVPPGLKTAIDLKNREASLPAITAAKTQSLTRTHELTGSSGENNSHVRALQRKVKARTQEVRNDNWSDLKVNITPSHQDYWRLAKALKIEGYNPTLDFTKFDNSIAFNDREKVECLADSIEQQCYDNPPYDLEHTYTGMHRFFNITSSHPNPLLVSAVSYEPPTPHHFCRRSRNILSGSLDDLTVEVKNLIEVNKMAINYE